MLYNIFINNYPGDRNPTRVRLNEMNDNPRRVSCLFYQSIPEIVGSIL